MVASFVIVIINNFIWIIILIFWSNCINFDYKTTYFTLIFLAKLIIKTFLLIKLIAIL